MIELLSFLKSLITTPGLSGYEMPVRSLIEAAWEPLTDELAISPLGSLHGLKRGNGTPPRPKIMLAAHMDTIGLMVSSIVGEFLRVTEVGGLDERVLPGQLVIVHGRQDLPGVIVQPPAHLLPESARSGPIALKYLLVDTGLPERELRQLVRIGDMVSFAQAPMELSGETLAGRYLDNRASAAALTLTLQELQGRTHAWDVWAVATVQEEETFGGARTSAFAIRPDLAVAVDVTHAKGPGSVEHKSFPLGKGPTIGWGPNIHPALYKSFKELAEQLEIPHQIEVMPRHSGTDAFAIQVVAEGIPSMVISIPLRYMHTPVEVVALKDIQRAAHLLSEFIVRLEPDYLSKVTWEEKP